ncbi:carboxylesterase family protein [bacterium]|nr:carboxylesterase family protein [bacterium]
MSAINFFAIPLLFLLGPVSADPKEASAVVEKTPTGEVTIDSGKVRGLLIGDKKDIEAFKGIPYAAPPIGELRWKAPQPPAKWEGVRDAFAFSAACPQRTPAMMKAIPQMAINAPYSEDCLYLNVWTPKDRGDKKLPVLYWIHGGGYTMGAASQPLYDGEHLSRLGCVVVSINYRLGPFGFLAHPALSKESTENVSGNYGLLDQIEGLRWVKRNIASFGGDPEHVLIFGESAGGGSVLALMCSPLAKELFQSAAAQSAPEMDLGMLRKERQGRPSAEAEGASLIEKCGLTSSATPAEMRKLDADLLVKTFPALEVDRNFDLNLKGMPLPIGPIVDGYVIPGEPNLIFAAGKENPVPMIIGNTKDEMVMFLMGTKTPTEPAHYMKELKEDYADLAEALAKAYPATNGKEIRAAITELLGDAMFVSQSRYGARLHAANGNKSYRYEFARGSKQGILRGMGAHHGAELAFLFQIPAQADETDKEIARVMGQYWINLAATGNPNGEGLPNWPSYTVDTDEVIRFNDKVETLKQHRKEKLDTIDQHLRSKRSSAEEVKGN